MSAISTTDVDVILGASRILHGITMNVEEGETVAILGANGSGKSTLIRAIVGIIPVSHGTIDVFGHPISHRRSAPWGRIGYVPQRVAASSGVPATALEVVRSGLLGPHNPLADRGPGAKRRAMEALEAVGLADRARDHVQVFSGGQSQRVLIARALVRKPDLLILDEPLAGIDHESRETLAKILTDLHGAGVTIVTVLHELGELAGLIGRAVVLEDGHIVRDGTPVGSHASEFGTGASAATLVEPVMRDDDGHLHTDDAPVPHHAPVLRTETHD